MANCEADRTGLHLPNEIVDLILDGLAREELVPLTFVSRQWYQAAQARVYKSIRVGSGEGCKYWSKKFRTFPNLGSFVRSLELSDPDDDCLGSPYMRSQPAKSLAKALTRLRYLEVSGFKRWGPPEQRLLKTFQTVENLSLSDIPGMSRTKDLPDLVHSLPNLNTLTLWGNIGAPYIWKKPASYSSEIQARLPSDGEPTKLVNLLGISEVEICHDQLRWFASSAFDHSRLRTLSLRWSTISVLQMIPPPSFEALDNLIIRICATLTRLDLGFPTCHLNFPAPAIDGHRDLEDLLTGHLIESRILHNLTAITEVRLDQFRWDSNLELSIATAVPILKTINTDCLRTIELSAGSDGSKTNLPQYLSLPEWKELDNLLVSSSAFPVLRIVKFEIRLNSGFAVPSDRVTVQAFRTEVETKGLPKAYSRGLIELTVTI